MGGDTASVILILTDGALSDEASADNQVLWQNICLTLDIYMWTDINLRSSSEGSGPKKPIFKNDTDVLAVDLHIVHVLSIFYLGTLPIKSINALLYIRMKTYGLAFSLY